MRKSSKASLNITKEELELLGQEGEYKENVFQP